MSKLEKLLEIDGYDTLEELLEATFSDSASPGICTNDGCDYTVEVEPDQDQGWCENCGTSTVKSALIRAGAPASYSAVTANLLTPISAPPLFGLGLFFGKKTIYIH